MIQNISFGNSIDSHKSFARKKTTMLEFFSFVLSVCHHLHIGLNCLNTYMLEGNIFSLRSILQRLDLASALYTAERKKISNDQAYQYGKAAKINQNYL